MAVTTITKKHTLVNFSNQKISPKYIVWHDTGVRDQSDEGNANYFYSVYRDASANFFIDENSITEVVEPGYVAWHCGDGKGVYGITNYNSIGIELCVEADGNFKPETIANAVWLGKKLMTDFNIGYDGNVRHYDASRKNCPQFLNTDGKWSKWYSFKAQLALASATITRVSVSYDRVVSFGGYSIDSKPYGEAGSENWGKTDNFLNQTVKVVEENASGEYLNTSLGWIDKRALTEVPMIPVRVQVSYNAVIKNKGYSIDSKPWGEKGQEYWGVTDDFLEKVVKVVEESASGEYVNTSLGWIDKRAIEKEKVVIASILFLPNGQNWVIYDENGPYEVGEVISVEGKEGSWYTILGDKGNNILIVELQKLGRKAIYFDTDKGATIEKIYG